MAAPVDIANNALARLGQAAIVSMSDTTPAAQACARQYDLSRLAELEVSSWVFATKRGSLPALASAPAFGFAYAYQFPSEAIRMIQIGEFWVGSSTTDYRGADESPFAIEGRQILTNLGAPLAVKYVSNVTDSSQFSPLFVQAVGCRLAMDLCQKLTGSGSLKESIRADYKQILAAALRSDAIQKPPVQPPDNSWINSRL